MSDIIWTNTSVKLGDLKPWGSNPKTSTKKDARLLLKSWDELSQFQTIAIGPGGDVYDGHQRLSALLTVYGAGYEIDVRVSSRDLTEQERKKIALYSRQIGAWDWDILSGFDTAILNDSGFDGDLLKDWKRDVAALDNFLKSEQVEPVDAEPQIDRAAELNEKWQVKPGDLWRIGEHRLLCGDSTKREDVERVMAGEKAELVFTDPPYGVSVGDKNKYLNSIARSNRVEENLENDTAAEPDLVAMLCASFDNSIASCSAGAAWYVAAPPGPLHVLFGQALKDRGIWRQTIQWVKNNSTFSPMGVCYHWQAEPIFFGWLPNGAHRYYGGRQQTTVWNIDRPLKSAEHPTMKPVELVQRAIRNSSLADEIVIDFFCGSGTTMIASENEGRKCRAIEISPNYCAVILERMATAFPELVIERE